MQSLTRTLLSSSALFLVLGCGTGADAPKDAPPASIPAHVWSATPLAGAVDVKDAREKNKDGDTVVLRGTLQDFGDLGIFDDEMADEIQLLRGI